MKFTKELSFDVAVAGGGVAGIAAAVEAARAGKKVVIIEKTLQLGGLATIGLINYFVPMCNGRGVQIIKGMADEFLRLSIKYGFDTLPADWQNGEPGFGKTDQRLVSRYSAPIFSLALTELLKDLCVDMMFDTIVTSANVDNGHITDIEVYNKSGFTKISAKVFIDATGDSDLLFQAGVPTITGGNYHTYIAFGATIDSCKKVVETGDIGKLNHGFSGGNSNLYGGGHPKDMPLWDGTNADQVSKYIVDNQIAMLNKIKDDDRRSRDITHLPIMPQFRTTRHIDGDYTLKEEDAYKHFEDSICAICDFDRRDYLFEVPYRTMTNSGFDNILAVGRCASAKGYAWDVLRVIPPAILTGQAAGAAAALSIAGDTDILNIDIKLLQHKLESENVMIHFKDEWVPHEQNADSKYESDHI